MARAMHRGKKGVDLSAGRQVRSRIRRDPPPPPPKKLTRQELRERDARTIVLGIATFTLALFVIVVALGSWAGWSPAQYEIVIRES